jgi:bifunctional oligoribonuclease and PAP phosphatase NrnA
VNIPEIHNEKFESSYKVLSGEYTPHPEFLPEAHYVPSIKNIRNELDEIIEKYIRPCVARGETRIYAKQLAKSAKVFTTWNKGGISIMPGRLD